MLTSCVVIDFDRFASTFYKNKMKNGWLLVKFVGQLKKGILEKYSILRIQFPKFMLGLNERLRDSATNQIQAKTCRDT